MPRKTQKRKKTTAVPSKRRISPARKTTASAKKAVKGAVKAAGSGAKKVKKAVTHPRRTLRRAATNVHETAGRARDVGDTIITAGEVLKDVANFADSVAMRAKARTKTGRKGRKST